MQKFLETVKPVGARAFAARLARTARSAARTDRSQAAAEAPAPLGNNTKSRAAIRYEINENTDEIQGFTLDEARREYRPIDDRKLAVSTARNARFSAQSSVTKLLAKKQTPRGNPATPEKSQWRVTGCSRRKIAENVGVLYSKSVKKAHFGGLMVCGSVWTCPPCAAKISERRKNEIKQATDLHVSHGGSLYMLSFTFSHGRQDVLSVILAKFSKARMHLRSQRAYKNLKRDMGYLGDIRTLEVTYGDANGFHPHEHDLWLVADGLARSQMRRMLSVLFECWSKACAYAGLGAPNRKNGVNVIRAESAAEYMAKFGREPKWGVASELSKQHVKVGKAKSLSPFDLLRAYQDGSKRMGALFIEFAEAFFGKRMVVWSDGLKKLFGIGDMTDEEIAVQEAEDATELIKITGPEWKLVLSQPADIRSIILDIAEGDPAHGGGFFGVRVFLDSLVLDGAPF